MLSHGVEWTLHHPWLMLGALVLLGCAIGWTGKSRRKQTATSLLRSRKEQQRFSPLSTVYAPKAGDREASPSKGVSP